MSDVKVMNEFALLHHFTVTGSTSLYCYSKLYCWVIILKDSAIYHQVSDISRTLVGNNIVDHSGVVGASPVGAAPTTS